MAVARPAAAAPIGLLAWELPCAADIALKRKKKKKRDTKKEEKREEGSSPCVSAVRNLTSIHEDSGSIPGLAQWV